MSINTTHIRRQTELTLQDIPNREYTLKLFIENERVELQQKDNRTWAPAPRPYAQYSFITYTY